VEKLLDSEDFKKFKSENKDAFPASAFFVIDKQGTDNKQHLDYFVPSQKKMFSFKIEDGCKMVPVEMVDTSTLSKGNAIVMDHSFDFDDIERKIANEIGIRKMKNTVQKILISIQRKNGKDFALCTVFISGMGLLKVTITLEDMRVIDFEKKSFMDFLKIGKGKG
jgi:hypothetical protein